MGGIVTRIRYSRAKDTDIESEFLNHSIIQAVVNSRGLQLGNAQTTWVVSAQAAFREVGIDMPSAEGQDEMPLLKTVEHVAKHRGQTVCMMQATWTDAYIWTYAPRRGKWSNGPPYLFHEEERNALHLAMCEKYWA